MYQRGTSWHVFLGKVTKRRPQWDNSWVAGREGENLQGSGERQTPLPYKELIEPNKPPSE